MLRTECRALLDNVAVRGHRNGIFCPWAWAGTRYIYIYIYNRENRDNLKNRDNRDNRDNPDNPDNRHNPDNRDNRDNPDNLDNPDNRDNRIVDITRTRPVPKEKIPLQSKKRTKRRFSISKRPAMSHHCCHSSLHKMCRRINHQMHTVNARQPRQPLGRDMLRRALTVRQRFARTYAHQRPICNGCAGLQPGSGAAHGHVSTPSIPYKSPPKTRIQHMIIFLNL